MYPCIRLPGTQGFTQLGLLSINHLIGRTQLAYLKEMGKRPEEKLEARNQTLALSASVLTPTSTHGVHGSAYDECVYAYAYDCDACVYAYDVYFLCLRLLRIR